MSRRRNLSRRQFLLAGGAGLATGALAHAADPWRATAAPAVARKVKLQ